MTLSYILRRWVPRLVSFPAVVLLAALLVLAQQGAAAHALTHLPGDEHGAPEPVCEWCAAYGHLGAAAPATLSPRMPALPQAAPAPCRHIPSVALTHHLAYRSQAPPSLS